MGERNLLVEAVEWAKTPEGHDICEKAGANTMTEFCSLYLKHVVNK